MSTPTDHQRIRRMLASATRLTDEDCLGDAEDVLLEALSLARTADEIELGLEVSSDLAGVHKGRGEFGKALKLIRDVRFEAERAGNIRLTETSLTNEATLLWEMGYQSADRSRLGEALNLANRAVALCEEHSWKDRLAFVLGTRALIERFLERWDDAARTFDLQLEVARTCEHPDLLARGLLNAISFNLERNDFSRAHELAREAVSIVDRISNVTIRSPLVLILRQVGMLG